MRDWPLQVWRAAGASWELSASGEAHPSQVTCIAGGSPAEGGRPTLATGAQDGRVRVWNPFSGGCEQTYDGHTGPVYRIRCSPFWPQVFLSCSADWTVKIWDQRRDESRGPPCQGGAKRWWLVEAPGELPREAAAGMPPFGDGAQRSKDKAV